MGVHSYPGAPREGGKCLNIGTELGFNVHNFFLKSRKAELLLPVCPDISNSEFALALKPLYGKENVTLFYFINDFVYLLLRERLREHE